MKEIQKILVVCVASIFSMETIEQMTENVLKIAPLISYGIQWTVGIATLVYILFKIRKIKNYERNTR